jgi:hypothetical protein
MQGALFSPPLSMAAFQELAQVDKRFEVGAVAKDGATSAE